jgi:rod shape-determining protein MreC
MNFFRRHNNAVVLAAVLLAQLLALAVQVKRQTPSGPVTLLRLVAVSTLSPFERSAIYLGEGTRHLWNDYIDLRHVRQENLALTAQFERVRLARLRELEDTRQAHRLQALLGFKENWMDQTVAAQVIGTGGTESSRLLYLDKGARDGVKVDQPVITPDGVVGKVLAVFGDHNSQVLLISDASSGVGALLLNSRLQGIVKGSPSGELTLSYIMGDETVQPGEVILTSGGDRIFPKGLPIGTVTRAVMGRNLFLDIHVKPAVPLNSLEEVLVITSQAAREPDTEVQQHVRASDILAQHLPGVPQPAAPAANTNPPAKNNQGAQKP